jgi:hypothetical protein
MEPSHGLSQRLGDAKSEGQLGPSISRRHVEEHFELQSVQRPPGSPTVYAPETREPCYELDGREISQEKQLHELGGPENFNTDISTLDGHVYHSIQRELEMEPTGPKVPALQKESVAVKSYFFPTGVFQSPILNKALANRGETPNRGTGNPS